MCRHCYSNNPLPPKNMPMETDMKFLKKNIRENGRCNSKMVLEITQNYDTAPLERIK